VSSAEQSTVCFLSLPGRPGLLPSLAGDSVSSRRIVPASSQPDSRPASVCLPVRLLCCPRAAADTRFVPSDTTTRRHHSSLGLRRHLFPLSDDCRPLTPHYHYHYYTSPKYSPPTIQQYPANNYTPAIHYACLLPVPLFVARDRSPCISLRPYTFQPLRLESTTRGARHTLQTQPAPSTTV